MPSLAFFGTISCGSSAKSVYYEEVGERQER